MYKNNDKDTSIFTRIADFSIKLFPLFFILIVYLHPLKEGVICDENYVCKIEHEYIFNIKTKKEFKVNSKSGLFFKKQEWVNLPISSRYSHPRSIHGYLIYPIMQGEGNHFYQVLIDFEKIFNSSEEVYNFIDEQRENFENYKNDSYLKYNFKINNNDINLFIIIFSFFLLIWVYVEYRKNPWDYPKYFYLIMAAILIRQSIYFFAGFEIL